MPYMPLSIMKALFVESPCRRSIGPCHCVDSVWVATAQRICCTCCCPSKDIRRTRAWGGIGEVGFLRPFSLMDFCILIVPFHTLFILILEFVCVFQRKMERGSSFFTSWFCFKKDIGTAFFQPCFNTWHVMIPNDYLWHGLFMGMKTPATWVCLREKTLRNMDEHNV